VRISLSDINGGFLTAEPHNLPGATMPVRREYCLSAGQKPCSATRPASGLLDSEIIILDMCL